MNWMPEEEEQAEEQAKNKAAVYGIGSCLAMPIDMLVMMPAHMLLEGVVLVDLWKRFLLPLGWATPSLGQMMGLSLMIALVAKPMPSGKTSPTTGERWFLYWAIPIIGWVYGYLVHRFVA